MTAVRSLQALVHGLIDYAGLYPPASLNMEESVARYAEHLNGPYPFILRRFVVSLDQLESFYQEIRKPQYSGIKQWRISLLTNGERPVEMPGVIVDAYEIKAASTEWIRDTAGKLGGAARLYFETDREFLRGLREIRAAAKIRTGGVTADAFPSAEEVVQFISDCAEAGCAFKATAGLHHMLRGQYRLTYDNDSDVATMHGFLNLFLAACFIYHGLDAGRALGIMKEQSVTSFKFRDDEVVWRDRSLSVDQITEARRTFCHSFGSCSFDEPVNELREAGLL